MNFETVWKCCGAEGKVRVDDDLPPDHSMLVYDNSSVSMNVTNLGPSLRSKAEFSVVDNQNIARCAALHVRPLARA